MMIAVPLEGTIPKASLLRDKCTNRRVSQSFLSCTNSQTHANNSQIHQAVLHSTSFIQDQVA